MAQAIAVRSVNLLALLKDAAREWSADKTVRLGAALAYYAVFSLAPLLLITISVAGLILAEAAAHGEVVEQLAATAAPTVAKAVEETMRYVHTTDSGALAALVGLGVMLVSAASLFGQLQDSLNTIWDVKARPGRGWLATLKERA